MSAATALSEYNDVLIPIEAELPPEEACKILGDISVSTLRDWTSNHKHKKLLAPIRYSHKVVRYPIKNLLAFKKACSAQY